MPERNRRDGTGPQREEPHAAMLTRLRRFLTEEHWEFLPHERPALPGSPGSVEHATRIRVAYGVIAILVGLTGGFGNALISANTTTLQGALGLDPSEIAWLPTVYVMTNVSINLLLIKFRAQFGLRPFALIFLGLYVAVTLGHLFVREFQTAILVRAISGMAGAPLSSLCLYYMMQALPLKWRLKAIVLGIGVPQCATPLARLFSPELLAMSQWRELYLFELGLSLMSFAAVALLRLPPTTRSKAFERLDFVTFALFAVAMALIAAVLGLGRYVWWTNAAWIGWALLAAIPMLAAALVIEHNRANPLLNTRWLGSADILRFAIVTIMARIVLSEQTYAAVGLLTVLGQNNDQLGTFFTVIFLCSAAGVALSAITLDTDRTAHPIMLAVRSGRDRRLGGQLFDQPDARAADVLDAGADRLCRHLFPGAGFALRHAARAATGRGPRNQLHRSVRYRQRHRRPGRIGAPRHVPDRPREGEQRRARPGDRPDRPDRYATARRGRAGGGACRRRSRAAQRGGRRAAVADRDARGERARL
jgi:MFS family permease